jgi:hypothetical protein
MPSAPSVVRDDMPTHSASGRRCSVTIRSIGTNVQETNGNTALMPLAASAMIKRRWRPVRLLPRTSGIRHLVHAAAGPGSAKAPAANRHSSASP